MRSLVTSFWVETSFLNDEIFPLFRPAHRGCDNQSATAPLLLLGVQYEPQHQVLLTVHFPSAVYQRPLMMVCVFFSGPRLTTVLLIVQFVERGRDV